MIVNIIFFFPFTPLLRVDTRYVLSLITPTIKIKNLILWRLKDDRHSLVAPISSHLTSGIEREQFL